MRRFLPFLIVACAFFLLGLKTRAAPFGAPSGILPPAPAPPSQPVTVLTGINYRLSGVEAAASRLEQRINQLEIRVHAIDPASNPNWQPETRVGP